MRLTFFAVGALCATMGCSEDFSKADAGDAGGADVGADSIGMIDGGGGADGDAMARPARRLFAGSKTIMVWNDSDLVTQDRAADFEIMNAEANGDIRAMEIAGDRLYAFNDTTTKLVAFDKAGSLSAMSAPAFSLDGSAFVGSATLRIRRIFHSNPGDLLITTDPTQSAVQLFKNATALSQSSKAFVRVGNLNEPIIAAVRDSNDRLFIGHLGQQIIKFVDNISSQSGGIQATQDFSGTPHSVTALAADDTRLYAFADVGGQPQILIYNLANVKPGAMPDVVLTKGLPSSNATAGDMVLANDTLVVSTISATGTVVVFPGAKTAGSQTQGISITADNIHGARLRVSTKTGLLYVAGSYKNMPAVTIWKNIATTPSLQAALTMVGTGNVSAIGLYEP